MNIQKTVGLDRDLALSLVADVIKTLDQSPLRPHIDAMMTGDHETALAIGKISGDAPDDLGLFLSMCRETNLLTMDEAFGIGDKFVDAQEASAAA